MQDRSTFSNSVQSTRSAETAAATAASAMTTEPAQVYGTVEDFRRARRQVLYCYSTLVMVFGMERNGKGAHSFPIVLSCAVGATNNRRDDNCVFCFTGLSQLVFGYEYVLVMFTPHTLFATEYFEVLHYLWCLYQ